MTEKNSTPDWPPEGAENCDYCDGSGWNYEHMDECEWCEGEGFQETREHYEAEKKKNEESKK